MANARLKINNVEKILKKQKGKRPILYGLNYNQDIITVCDSYVLIQVKSDVKVEDNFTIDIGNGSLLNGNYPSLEKIKPSIRDLEKVSKVETVFRSDVDNKLIYKINDKTSFNKKVVDDVIKAIEFSVFNRKELTSFQDSYENWYVGKQHLIYDNPEINLYLLVLCIVIEEK